MQGYFVQYYTLADYSIVTILPSDPHSRCAPGTLHHSFQQSDDYFIHMNDYYSHFNIEEFSCLVIEDLIKGRVGEAETRRHGDHGRPSPQAHRVHGGQGRPGLAHQGRRHLQRRARRWSVSRPGH